MNNRNNNGLVVVLCLVIVVLFASIIYLFASGSVSLNNNNSNENKVDEKHETNDEVKEETVPLSETDKKMFMDTLMSVYDASEYTVTSYNASTLSNVDKIRFAQYKLSNDGKKPYNGDAPNSYTLEELLSVTKKYFGQAGNFEAETVKCRVDGKDFLQYDATTQKFIVVGTHGHSIDNYFFDVVNQFVEGSINKQNGEIKSATIKLRKSFSPAKFADIGSFGMIRYGTFSNAVSNTNSVGDLSQIYGNVEFQKYNEYFLKHIETNPNLYPVHTYVFNYENGNYYLESIKVE